MKHILSLLLFAAGSAFCFAQTCNQPGALLTVRTAHAGEAEYVVFTFVDPHKPKGELGKTDNGPFIQMPLSNQIRVKGDSYYKIVFNNSPVHCDTRNYITPNKKIMDVKRLYNTDGIISYVVGLAKDAKITAHLAYNYHGFHIVKLKVQ
jgi:hypothetical protein